MRRKLEPFRFKEFSVSHSASTLPVGTDGVLLGAWVDVNNQPINIIEVGTGCGVIALCVAQKLLLKEYKITALELDAASVVEAKQNFNESIWKDQLEAVVSNYLNFLPKTKVDLLISNPPFFRNAYPTGKEYKQKAKHQGEGFSLEELAQYSHKHLSEKGVIALIYPAEDREFLIEIFLNEGFYKKRVCEVYAKRSKSISRILVEFSKCEEETKIEELVIYEEDNTYTQQYQNLTKNYYINF